MFQDMIQTDKFNKQNLRYIHVLVCKSDTPILSNRLWKESYLLIWTLFKRYCYSDTDCNAQSKFPHTDVIPKGIQVILLLFQNRRQYYQRGFLLKKILKWKLVCQSLQLLMCLPLEWKAVFPLRKHRLQAAMRYQILTQRGSYSRCSHRAKWDHRHSPLYSHSTAFLSAFQILNRTPTKITGGF